MASLGQPLAWEELPDEILLQILSYLEPKQLPRLQLVSRRLRDVCLDDELWKRHCFKNSQWYTILKARRQHRSSKAVHISNIPPNADGLANPSAVEPSWREMVQLRELQDMANWDPVFPEERVSWYEEYVQRHGPAHVNWLEIPRLRDGGLQTTIEARGVALFSPNKDSDGCGTMMAVSPLDDGSVCLWDVNGSRGKRGGIIAKSRPEILFADGPGTQNTLRSKKIDTGVTDCVSVDNNNHRAFFAIQSHLVEVDLNRLQVVNRESFEWSITTLSSVCDGVPLTVGTSLGIHLYDFRTQARAPHDLVERVDGPPPEADSVFKVIFDTKPLPPYAPLSQPTPINILHLPASGCENMVTDDIYVAGRFSNILHYDRRNFPKIVDSIYSGARLSSLAALPYPFGVPDDEARLSGLQIPENSNQDAKKDTGWTLIAGGEYKTKGSLEMYELESSASLKEKGPVQKSKRQNRQTAASSTILSVTNHGTRIALSDGSGLIKWFERDGFTECRRLKIGHGEVQAQSSLFTSMPGSDDLARKIVSLKSKHNSQHPDEDNILFWTGERLGMVSFTADRLFRPEDFEVQDPETLADEAERQDYSDRVREALERQADEARFVRGLGMGS